MIELFLLYVSLGVSATKKIAEGLERLLKNPKTTVDDWMDYFKKRKKEDVDEKSLDKTPDELRQIRNYREVPDIKFFTKWFDEISYDNFLILWKNEITQKIIKRRVRHPGGLHEWLMVARMDTFKKWGVSMNEIKRLRTKVDDVIFKNPPGKHGGFGSTKAHNEILDLIDNSLDFNAFKNKLIKWAENRLEGGVESLPKGFFE